jgi:hypothetical protein
MSGSQDRRAVRAARCRPAHPRGHSISRRVWDCISCDVIPQDEGKSRIHNRFPHGFSRLKMIDLRRPGPIEPSELERVAKLFCTRGTTRTSTNDSLRSLRHSVIFPTTLLSMARWQPGRIREAGISSSPTLHSRSFANSLLCNNLCSNSSVVQQDSGRRSVTKALRSHCPDVRAEFSAQW